MINLLVGATAALFLFGGAASSQAEYQTGHRGGQCVRQFRRGTIDPHLNYTLQYWQIY
jgi:peptide/nickel transport system substrate-binding protein